MSLSLAKKALLRFLLMCTRLGEVFLAVAGILFPAKMTSPVF